MKYPWIFLYLCTNQTQTVMTIDEYFAKLDWYEAETNRLLEAKDKKALDELTKELKEFIWNNRNTFPADEMRKKFRERERSS